MWLLIGAFILSIVIGIFFQKKLRLRKWIDSLVTYATYLLLFFLGISVGVNDKVIQSIHLIGYDAIVLTLGAILGSLLFIKLTYQITFKTSYKTELKLKSRPHNQIKLKNFKGSLIILSYFTIGCAMAFFDLFHSSFYQIDFTSYALYFLITMVGLSIGSDQESLSILRKINIKIVTIPLVIIIGSLMGTALFSISLPNVSIQEGMAVGAGLGYYSLSSILIQQIQPGNLGTIALLSNIIREIITLITTPVLIKYFSPMAGVASAGATAMDTTLPVIVKFSGKQMAVVAIFSGVVLTLLVPLLVTVILKF